MSLDKEQKLYLEKVGKRIVQIREEKGIKQKELADLLDMDDSSLRRIESGRTNPTTLTLLKITDALKVSMTEFFMLV